MWIICLKECSCPLHGADMHSGQSQKQLWVQVQCHHSSRERERERASSFKAKLMGWENGKGISEPHKPDPFVVFKLFTAFTSFHREEKWALDPNSKGANLKVSSFHTLLPFFFPPFIYLYLLIRLLSCLCLWKTQSKTQKGSLAIILFDNYWVGPITDLVGGLSCSVEKTQHLQ